MRISALSAASGVSVPTIKYYLREGLLPQGQTTSQTQARYDDDHVARLRLIRALVDVAGLSLAQVRDVVTRLDDPPESWHDVLGIAHGAAVAGPTGVPITHVADARALLADLGWQVDEHTPALAQLQRATEALADAGLDVGPERLAVYARAAHAVAEADLDGLPRTSPAEAGRHVVLGTLLYEPLLLALRRLAHEDVSGARYGRARATPPRRSAR
ncbi:MerR family transcriptional regulator [Angustibacter luteus]|uniref:MerR family transcriptional regulator n=1 Tax=Angustibacter luteus TaxID=658456 RepID=A0ABW1JH62_9ACTN